MTLGSIQPIKEMINRNIFLGGKGGRCVGSLDLLEASGPIRPVYGLLYLFTVL